MEIKLPHVCLGGLKRVMTVLLLLVILVSLPLAQAEPSLLKEGRERIANNGKAAPSGNPQVAVTIKRIQAIDPMDLIDQADWYFYVGFANAGSNNPTWTRYPSSGSNPNQDDWSPNWPLTFSPNVGVSYVSIVIMLCEDDSPLPNDYADVSDDSFGGIDDISGGCVPPSSGYYYGSYLGHLDLVTDVLSGNKTEKVGGDYKTSGDFDGSTGIDENDANVFFTVSDNYQPPTAKATASKTTAKKGETIAFDGSGSTGSQGSSIVSYDWDFGDSGKGSGVSASHAYTKAGTYYAKLTVKDDWNQVASDTVMVTVTNSPPVAAFSFTPQSAKTGDTITFADSSTDPDGDILTYAWDFGDGGTSTDKNPTHVYTTAGTFTIKLTVTDTDGATNSLSKTITITKENISPISAFTYSPTTPTTSDCIDFTDSSTDSDGIIAAWAWSFGNGKTSNQQKPDCQKYAKKGNFTVSLLVTDDKGATNTSIKMIFVANTPPVAQFTYTPQSPTTDDAVQFTDSSTDSDGSLSSWTWDFGDGTQSTQQNPTHKYASSGTFTVTLTVKDDNGDSISSTKSIVVVPGPFGGGVGGVGGMMLIGLVLLIIVIVIVVVVVLLLRKKKSTPSPPMTQPQVVPPQPQQPPQQPPSAR